jgi:hypothetical protein
MEAIRYDERIFAVGDYIPDSRVWIDGEPTDELLPGTCVLIPVQDQYTGHQYQAVFPHKYLVEGIWVADGEDDGEVVLANCRVLEIL